MQVLGPINSLASHLIQNPIQSKNKQTPIYFVISVWYRHTFHLTTFNPLVWTNPPEIKVLAHFS